MLAYLASRYFGLRSFAQIFSTLFAMVMFSMSLGPLVFGAVYDATPILRYRGCFRGAGLYLRDFHD